MRDRKTDLVMRLYATWASLQFQQAFHTIYSADFHDYDSATKSSGADEDRKPRVA